MKDELGCSCGVGLWRFVPVGQEAGDLLGREVVLGYEIEHVHVIDACTRLVESGRIGPMDPTVVAAVLWSSMHGYITLDIGDHFAEFEDPDEQIMLPSGVIASVGLGDDPERARASHEAAVALVPEER